MLFKGLRGFVDIMEAFFMLLRQHQRDGRRWLSNFSGKFFDSQRVLSIADAPRRVEFLPTRIEVSYTQQLHTTHRKTRVSTVLCTSYCIYVWYYPCTEVSSGQTIYLSSHTHAIGCRWPRALPCSGNPVRSCLCDALLLWIVYHTKAFTKTA